MSDVMKARVPTAKSVSAVTVSRTEWLTPAMVRVVFAGEAVRNFPDSAVPSLGCTDTYVKLQFGGALRAYTLRSVNREAGELVIDFVVHGDEGLAGPWAAAAKPGDSIGLVGPGGEWSPRAEADAHLLVGDEAALPAIAASLDRLLADNPTATALVFVEIEGAAHEYPLASGPNVELWWIHRDGASYGERLVEAVLTAPYPDGDVEAFVHGNADMVRPVRRYLLRDHGLERAHLSASGYWRAGLTDEAWRAAKRDFYAAMESDAEGKA